MPPTTRSRAIANARGALVDPKMQYTVANALESRRDLDGKRIRQHVTTALREYDSTPRSPSVEQRYERAWGRYVRSGAVTPDLVESRTFGTGEGVNGGGYTVPQRFYAGMLAEAKTGPWPLLGNASILETPGFSAPMNYPVLKDGSVVAPRLGETLQAQESDFTLGNIAYGLCPCYVAGALSISMAAYQDVNSDDLHSAVTDAWNLRTFSGVEVDAAATVIAGCSASTSASPTALVYTDLLNAFFAIPILYRASSIWIFSTAAMKSLRSLTDATTNRPVLLDLVTRTQPNDAVGSGVPVLTSMLLGLPAYESNNGFANTMTATSKVGFIGSPSRVLPVRRGPAELQFLKETFISYGSYSYIGRQFWDASQIGIAAAGLVIQLHA